MSNLLTLKYWLDPLPGPWLDENVKIVYAVFGLLIIAGMIAWVYRARFKNEKLYSKLWRKIEYFCLTIGIVGLLLALIREQNIYILSMPFFYMVLFLASLWWLYKIYKYASYELPRRKKEIAEEKRRERYLP